MHIARQAPVHMRLHNNLEERDPSLINLPLPVPSVPVLAPVLSPLIQGNNPPTPNVPAPDVPAPNVPSAPPTPSSPPALISVPVPIPSVPVIAPVISPIIQGNNPPTPSVPAPNVPAPNVAPPTPSSPPALISVPVPMPSVPILAPVISPIIQGNNPLTPSVPATNVPAPNVPAPNVAPPTPSSPPALISVPVPIPSVPAIAHVISPIIQGNNAPTAPQSNVPATEASPPPSVPVPSILPVPIAPVPNVIPPLLNPSPSSAPEPPQPTGPASPPNSDGGGNSVPAVGSSGGSNPSPGNSEPSSSPDISSIAGPDAPPTSTPTSSTDSVVSDLSATALSNNTSASPSDAAVPFGLKSALAAGTGQDLPSSTSTISPFGPNGSGSGGGSTPSNSGSGSGTGNQAAISSHKGLSAGAIAGISVVGAAACLILVIFLLRKRSRARRSERRRQWWQRSKANEGNDTGHNEGGGGSPTGRGVSWRSSFGTTIDRGQTPHLVDFDAPPVPPMAEVRGVDSAHITSDPFSPVQDSPVLIAFDNAHLQSGNNNITSTRRFSVHSANSVHSQNSDSYAQYLTVANSGFMDGEIRTPMSVRPFSPSESFAFPKPPKEASDRNSTYSRPASTVTQTTVTLSAPPSHAKSPNGSRVLLPSTPASPAITELPPQPNPFADPTFDPKFAEVEIVQRPFVPTLSDELPVVIGDRVKVIKVFDDGWAMVQKIVEDTKSSAAKNRPQSGLIPIDCMRAVGQDLPAFLSEKRVSSTYIEDIVTGRAF